MRIEGAPWWKSGVVYQVYPRSFQDSNGDGVGDLPGITGRLQYIADLGVQAVWLSPFYRSPMADFGYDVSDYCDVDPMFGTLADFDALLAFAHELELKVIVDFVPNHSSDQHPWFAESRSSRDNPKRDWYTWRPPTDREDIGNRPNNWLAVFGGPAWTLDPATGEYYLHSFLPEQPDVNWRNPDLRAAMIDAMRFWLDRGVDGFRFDVAHSIMKDPALRDNPPAAADWRTAGLFKPMGEFGAQQHIYDRAHPDLHGVYREVRALLDSYERDGRPRFSIGEIHVSDMHEWAGYFGENDELHMPYNFTLLKTDWTPSAIRSTIEACEASLVSRPWAWPNWVLGNHDEHRVASRLGAGQARNAMLLLLTLRGTPTIYYGDELGMPDVPIAEDHQQDPWAIRVPGYGLGRDPERTPMQWDATENAGFALPAAVPWLPIATDHALRNVKMQRADEGSMLAFTRALLHLRQASAALSTGSYTSIDVGDDRVLAYQRSAGDERIICVLNLSAQIVAINVPGDILLHTTADAVLRDTDGSLVLAGDAGAVLRPSGPTV